MNRLQFQLEWRLEKPKQEDKKNIKQSNSAEAAKNTAQRNRNPSKQKQQQANERQKMKRNKTQAEAAAAKQGCLSRTRPELLQAAVVVNQQLWETSISKI